MTFRTRLPAKLESGYTLVELVITTALLAILIQIAVPALTGLLASWQRDSATRSITDHLTLARSEAIRWSQRVVMCNSTNGVSCAPASEKDWKSGWLVFQDLDGDGQRGDADKLITLSQGIDGVSGISGNAGAQRFVFMPTGMMSSGMRTLTIKPRTGAEQKIIVNRIGRVRISEGTAAKPG